MATVSELLELARKQLGVKESPPGSNNVRYNTWYYGREVSGPGYAWCVVLVQWVFDQAGVRLPARTASCTALMNAAKAAGRWVTGDYRPGDVVIYDWGGDRLPDHCGIVEAVEGTYLSAIEGNTSAANDSDGGAVERRARKCKQVLGAVRPTFDKEEDAMAETRYNTVEECPDWARETVRKLVDRECLTGDGQGLDLSRDMLRVLVVLDRAGCFGE